MRFRRAPSPARASRAPPTPSAPPGPLRARPAHPASTPVAARWCAAAWAAGARVAPFPARRAVSLARSPATKKKGGPRKTAPAHTRTLTPNPHRRHKHPYTPKQARAPTPLHRAPLRPPFAPPARRAFTTPLLGAPPRQPALLAPPARAGPRWAWQAWQPAPTVPRASSLAPAAPPLATSAALAPSASMARSSCARRATTQARRAPAPAANAPRAPSAAPA
jgi:hypothetical protein